MSDVNTLYLVDEALVLVRVGLGLCRALLLATYLQKSYVVFERSQKHHVDRDRARTREGEPRKQKAAKTLRRQDRDRILPPNTAPGYSGGGEDAPR